MADYSLEQRIEILKQNIEQAKKTGQTTVPFPVNRAFVEELKEYAARLEKENDTRKQQLGKGAAALSRFLEAAVTAEENKVNTKGKE